VHREGRRRGCDDAGVSLTVIVEVLIAALVLFGVGAAATGRLPGLADVPADEAGDGLPAGALRAEDLAAARFPLAARGYRMGAVDAVLARAAAELAERDAEIAHLRGGPGPGVAATRATESPEEPPEGPPVEPTEEPPVEPPEEPPVEPQPGAAQTGWSLAGGVAAARSSEVGS